MNSTSGQCLCGAVTIDVEGTPAFQGNCHCLHCRRATSARFASIAFFPMDKVTVKGAVKCYEHKADSGSQLKKNFCPECGTLVFGSNSSRPGMLSVYAGLFENPAWLKPEFNVWLSRALPGTHIDASLKNYEKGRT